MFENYRVFETELAGRPLVVETGKIAQLANGAAFVRYGDTVVNVAVTASEKPREGVDFFPLSVDFEEKLYSVGKIPGSFQRREGRPADKAILASRVIDRPIRPLFPKDMRNDVAVVCTVMSVDPDCSPEITAMIGTSIALSISDIPWNGPISGVSVGYVDGEYVINPNAEQREKSEMAVTVASTSTAVYGNDNVRLLGGDVSDGFANAAQNFRNARNNLRQPHNRQVADVKQGFKPLLFHIFAADAGKFRLRRKFFQRVH